VTALLYDIHGNLPALEAVLEDVAGQGEQRFLLGGDYALFGAWPRETVVLLRELDAIWLRGNGERWTAEPAEAPEAVRAAAERCGEMLGDDLVNDLSALPESYTEGDTMFCHGSPRSDVRSFMPEPAEDEEELLEGVLASRLVFGHTHLPFVRSARGGIELLNPGSVGMPFDGDPRAAWARLHDDGTVEHRRVPYDRAASADAVRAALGEAGEVPARRIERATADVE
jgi:diadenosine tetraphosphatase ApaH/serine/threonine PP2A family protein phosphatase